MNSKFYYGNAVVKQDDLKISVFSRMYDLNYEVTLEFDSGAAYQFLITRETVVKILEQFKNEQ